MELVVRLFVFRPSNVASRVADVSLAMFGTRLINVFRNRNVQVMVQQNLQTQSQVLKVQDKQQLLAFIQLLLNHRHQLLGLIVSTVK